MDVYYSCYINKISYVRLICHFICLLQHTIGCLQLRYSFYALGMEDFIVLFLIKVDDIVHR